jgi:hypothetical protein
VVLREPRRYVPDFKIHTKEDEQLAGRRKDTPRENVTKDEPGNLTVLITPMVHGKPKEIVFFSREDDCETMVKTRGLKPDHTPSGDIN